MQQKTSHSADHYINGILHKDRIILSKAITLIESTRPEDEALSDEILQACIKTKRVSKRIAITGAPGAGKSTFINAFGQLLSAEQLSLAVLAVDPSSTISKGSILGDKTRMEDIVNNDLVYIRPTASSSILGGVARTTRETIVLCEAFGFDYIFVETVGVGQSETMVKNMTDLFLLLLLPNAGDELQGLKRGIMEMADIVLINKSDRENLIAAKTAATQVKHALHLYNSTEKDWAPQVLHVSSMERTGLAELKKTIDAYFLKMKTSGFLQHNREQQQIHWMEETIVAEIRGRMNEDETIRILRAELEEQIRRQETDAKQAAKLLVKKLFKKG